MATRKWLLKQPSHRSRFVNIQRAISLRSDTFLVTEFKRTRYHITPAERKKYSIKARPSSSYRAARRNAARVTIKQMENGKY